MPGRKQMTGRVFLALLLALGTATNLSAQLGKERIAEEDIRTREMPERVTELKIDAVIALLGLKPGDVVADIGAGSGTFSRPFARAVAPAGTVYAVEIEPDLIKYINERSQKEDIGNIRTVLGGFDDPKLPVRNVDVTFFHRVLHHIEHRALYLQMVATYLKPDGRIVVIEKPTSDDWMWLKRKNVDDWMAAIGFYPLDSYGLYKDKYFVVYQRPYGDSPLIKKKDKEKKEKKD